MENTEKFEAVVIGAGHAGCEASLALARKGHKTLLLSLNLDAVAFLACNPSIGGTAKGQLVCEIDALGGEMGVNTDKIEWTTLGLYASRGGLIDSVSFKSTDIKEAKKLFSDVKLKKSFEDSADKGERLVLKGKYDGKEVSVTVYDVSYRMLCMRFYTEGQKTKDVYYNMVKGSFPDTEEFFENYGFSY